MRQQRTYIFGSKPSPLGNFGAILTLVLILIGVYYLIKGVYFVLGIIAPILLIATLIIDHNVIVNYLKFIWNLLKNNVLMGLVAVLLTVVGAPFVSGFLFAKAWMNRSVKKFKEEVENERYVKYEEIEEEDEDFLILPDVESEQPAPKKSRNDYEDLFE